MAICISPEFCAMARALPQYTFKASLARQVLLSPSCVSSVVLELKDAPAVARLSTFLATLVSQCVPQSMHAGTALWETS